MGFLARIFGRERQNSNQIGDPVPIAGYYGPLVNYQELYQTIYALPQDQQRLISVATGRVAICANLRACYAANVPIREYTFKGSRSEKSLPCRGISRKTRQWLKSMHAGKSSMYADGVDELVEIEQSEELDLLKDPSPDYSGVLFHRFDYLCRDFVGNSYWLITEPKNPLYATPLWPQWVTIIPGTDRLVKEYGFGRNRGQVTRYQPDQVLHLRHSLSPHSPLYGIGPLHHVAQQQRVLQMALAWELAYWQNDATPNGVYSLDATLAQNKTVVDQIRALVEQRHQGPAKAGRALFLPGVEWQPTSQVMREMQYQEGVKAMLEMVDSAFGVCGMLNPSDSGGGSVGDKGGAQNAVEERFLRQTITPLVANKADQLTEGLLPYFGIDPGKRWFAPEMIHRDDPIQLSMRHATYLDKGVLSINEARADIDLEPIDGGDVYRINGTALEDIGKVGPFGGLFGAPGNGGRGDLNGQDGPADDKEPTGTDGDTGKGDEGDQKGRNGKHGAGCKCGSGKGNGDDQSKCNHVSSLRKWIMGGGTMGPRRKDMKIPDDNVNSLARACQRWLNQLDASAPGGMLVFDAAEAAQLFRQEAIEPITTLFASGYDFQAVKLGGATTESLGAFAVDNPHTMQYLTEHVFRLSQTVTGTVEEELRGAIVRHVEEGLPIDQTTRAVKAALGDIKTYAAERIARTESGDAYVAGNIAAAVESGVVEGKLWLASSNACEFCKEAERVFNANGPVPLTEPFAKRGSVMVAGGHVMKLDYKDVQGPTLHPNCTCDIIMALAKQPA